MHSLPFSGSGESEPTSFGHAVDPELAYKVQKRSKLFRFGSHEVLFRQGDDPESVFLIQRGEALLTMRVNGVTVMRVPAGAGSLLGLPGVVGGRPYTLGAQALGELEAYRIGADQFLELMRDEPQLSLVVLRIMASEIHSAREAWVSLADKALSEN